VRVTMSVPINNIIVEREPIGPDTLALVDYLRAEDEGPRSVPPVHLQPTGNGQYRICDGRHRVLAYKLLGLTAITAHVGIKEDPKIDKDLPFLKSSKPSHIPQADGCSYPPGMSMTE